MVNKPKIIRIYQCMVNQPICTNISLSLFWGEGYGMGSFENKHLHIGFQQLQLANIQGGFSISSVAKLHKVEKHKH